MKNCLKLDSTFVSGMLKDLKNIFERIETMRDKLNKVNIVFPSYKPDLDLHKSYLSIAEGVGIRNLVDHLNSKYPEYCKKLFESYELFMAAIEALKEAERLLEIKPNKLKLVACIL